MENKYPHLIFKRNWEFSQPIMFLLGQCEAFMKAITNTPILPEHHKILLNVSLKKGAQATTAIEGNTLSDEEIEKIIEGQKLPPSKEYQEIEVANILEAFNILLKEVVYEKKDALITSELMKSFHQMVGKNLGVHFDAIPGQFRQDNHFVGPYRCPDPKDVDVLVKNLCNWLLKEFNYPSGEQRFWDVIVQAIVTHIYIEWIHPFGDGNGRTGRLVEFYILLRGGNPDIASHILSNHYNQTRSEYYRQIENARKKKSLTEFIEYALVGYRDGLENTLKIIQESLFQITWQKLIYDKFKEVKIAKRDVLKRRRELVISMPFDKGFNIDEIILINPNIARMYATLSKRSIIRDLTDIIAMDLLYKENDKYFANTRLLKGFVARRRHNNNR